MMRSARTISKCLVSPPLQAAALLAVLVAHLAYMTTPLHMLMRVDEPHAATLAMMANDEAAIAIEGLDARSEHASDCGIQWAKAASGTPWAGFLSVTPTGSIVGLDQRAPVMRLTARALGPPETGDQQALLQVFRL